MQVSYEEKVRFPCRHSSRNCPRGQPGVEKSKKQGQSRPDTGFAKY